MKILIAVDAWFPYMSGVIRTFSSTIEQLRRRGDQVKVIYPTLFRTIPCPTYPDLRVAIWVRRKLGKMIDEFDPDAIHIGTEGTVGAATRRWCLKRGIPFTTSFTTKLPEYIQARFFLPPRVAYAWLRRFHAPASCCMVSTDSVEQELHSRGFGNLVRWSRGVDTNLFCPRGKDFLTDPRPIWMHVGRVAVEKNIGAFLDLDLPGTKYVVGCGPQLNALKRKYPNVRFVGEHRGEELARYYSAADATVMPSLTETFGLVILESLACGVPVAAYPVTGPKDVIGNAAVGALDEDLGQAAREALEISPQGCRTFARKFTWENSTQQFRENLHPFKSIPIRRAA